MPTAAKMYAGLMLYLRIAVHANPAGVLPGRFAMLADVRGSLMAKMMRGCGATGLAFLTRLTLQRTSDLSGAAPANVSAHLGDLPHGILGRPLHGLQPDQGCTKSFDSAPDAWVRGLGVH